MKTFSYLIDGDISLEIINEIKGVLDENTPQGVSFTFAGEPLAVCATVDASVSDIKSKDIEEILLPLFEERGLKLILPANTKHFSYIGEKKVTAEKKFSTRTLISAIIITLVVSVLFTYVFASGLLKFPTLTQKPAIEITDISDATHQVEILNEIFAQLEFDYDKLDKDALTDYLLKAYVKASGDPYAVYYNAEEYAEWLESQKGNTAGIGVTVRQAKITVDGESITVAEVLYVHAKSPAMAAGVSVGDYIYAIGKGAEYKEINTIGYETALNLMVGEVNSVADISLYRRSGTDYEKKDFSITRTEFEGDTVLSYVSEADSSVGIVKLMSFGLKTPKQFSEAVDSLKAAGCEYFVFDLRSNPGGDLKSISAILSYFLNPGDLIVSIEYADGKKTEYIAEPIEYKEDDVYYDCSVKSEDIGKYKGLKFNILTDKSTASAAELFTATVRDYNLGKIIGEERTYGKGCMQTILPLSSYGLEGGLRVTTSMYFSKSHTVYHEVGIVPDIIEPLSNEAKNANPYRIPYELDNQLQAAIADLKK